MNAGAAVDRAASRIPRTIRSLRTGPARATQAALLAIATLTVTALILVVNLVASAGRVGADRPPVPEGVIAVSSVPAVVTGSGATRDELGVTQTPPLSPRIVDAVERSVEGGAVRDPIVQLVLSAPSGSADKTFRAQPAQGRTWAAAEVSGVRLLSGHPPAADDEAAIGEGLASAIDLAAGDTLVFAIQTPTGEVLSRAVRVTGVTDDAGPTGPDGILLPESAIAGSGDAAAVTRLWVRDGNGRLNTPVSDALAAGRTGQDAPAVVVSAGQRLPVPTDVDSSSAVGLATILGGVVALVCSFLLVGTTALSVVRRGRELALLRLTGAEPRQIRRQLVSEACWLAAGAALIGFPLGYALSPLAILGLRNVALLPERAPIVVTVWAGLVAAAVGLVLLVGSVLVGARRLSRIQPVQALREHDAPTRRPGWRRRLGGALALTGAAALGLGIGQVAPSQAANLALTLAFVVVIAMIFLGPDIARFVLPVLSFLLGRVGASGYAAARSLRREPFRAAALAQPVLVATAIGTVLLGTGQLLDRSLEVSARDSTATTYLRSVGGVPASSVAYLRTRPEVRAAVLVTPSEAVLRRPGPAGLKPYRISAVDGDLAAVHRFRVLSGRLGDLRGGDAWVSSEAAQENDIKVGSNMTFYAADGQPREVTIRAVVDSGGPFGDLVVARTVLPTAVLARSPGTFAALNLADGADPVAVTAGAGSSAWPVSTLSAAAWGESTGTRAARDVNGVTLIVAVVLGLGVCGLVVIAGVDIASRRRELAQLRATGATRRQVTRMLSLEGAAACIVGGLIASVTAAAGLAMLGHNLPGAPTPNLTGVVAVALLGVVGGAVSFSLLSTPLTRVTPQLLVEEA